MFPSSWLAVSLLPFHPHPAESYILVLRKTCSIYPRLLSFSLVHTHTLTLTELAEPVLRCLAWVVVWVGACGGASAQVAVLADLLDLATLHLYCFYVYAARYVLLGTLCCTPFTFCFSISHYLSLLQVCTVGNSLLHFLSFLSLHFSV